MKLQRLIHAAFLLFVAPSLFAQSQVATLGRVCPKPPYGGTAWFDTCAYLPIGNGVKTAQVLAAPDPEYSEAARRAKITGQLELAVALNADGKIDGIKVVHSLEPGLDANAVAAVRKWQFTPATKDGEPVPVQFLVQVGFNLK